MGKSKNSQAKGGKGVVVDADDDALLNAAIKENGSAREKAAEMMDEAALWFDKQNYGQAVAKITEAIATDPNCGVNYSKRSIAWLAMGDTTKAAADAKVGANMGGGSAEDNANCWAHYGFCLGKLASAHELGNFQASLDAYDKGLKCSPSNAACLQGKEETKAMMALQKRRQTHSYVQCGPDDVEAQELRTLPAPEGVLGKGFEVVCLQIGGCDKPLTFLLSTTLNEEIILTPAACTLVGRKIARTVDLDGVFFEGGKEIGSLKNVPVTGFVQAQIAEKALGTKLDGMLGLPFLSRFDLDLDRLRREQRFKEAGAAAKVNATAKPPARIGSVHISSIQLPGSLIGIPMQVEVKSGKTAYVLGVIDTASMFSVVNYEAAEALGLAADPDDESYEKSTKVAGATKDGVVEMPLVNVKVRAVKSSEEIGCRLMAVSKEEFDKTGKGAGWSLGLSEDADLTPCAEFGRVNVAMGNAIQFEMLKDSAVGEFRGAGMLVGQDILAQLPKLTVSAKDRQLWMDPPTRIIDESPL